MGIVDGDAEVKNHIHTSPVAQSDGHTIGVLFVDILDVLVEPTLNRSHTMMDDLYTRLI